MKHQDHQEFLDWVRQVLGTEIQYKKHLYGDEGSVYHILTDDGDYYLKIRVGSDFSSERAHLAWLQNKLPVPKVIDFVQLDGMGAILLNGIKGKNLAVLSKEWSTEKVVSSLVAALQRFHAVNPSEWPFEKSEDGNVLVHGDACLPNFIFLGGALAGYVDVGGVKVASPDVDLAAAVWSLQYNLGPGYGIKFLREYGWSDVSEREEERLRLQYESWQQAHGFLK